MFSREADLYTLYGASIGILLALLGTFFLSFHHFSNFTLSSIASVQNEYFLLWILDTSPIWLGMLGRLAGLRLEEINEQNSELQDRLNEMKSIEEDLGNRLDKILENTSDEIFICRLPDFKIIQASRGICDQLGYSTTELLEMHLHELFHDLDRKQLEEWIDPLLRGDPHPVSISHTQWSKDGLSIPMQFQLTVDSVVSPNFLTGIAIDSSYREVYKDALARERKKFFDILENLPIAFHLQAQDYTVPFGNKMFRERFGQPASKPCYSLMHNRTAPCEICQPFQVFRTQEEVTSIWNANDGKTYLTMCTPYTDIDQRPLVMEMALDITEMEQAKKTAIKALEEAEQSNRSKFDFLARMSFELRTPLNAILGFIQLMELDKDSLNPEHRNNVSNILRASQYLLDLMNEVLELARIDSGEAPLTPSAFRLKPAIAELLESTEHLALEKSVRLKMIAEDELVMIHTDEARFKQILQNLLLNAIHYNKPNGSVEVRFSHKDNETLLIEVEDTGCGIPTNMLDKVFDPLHQWDGNSQLVKEGIGIGLSISRRLAELLGGNLEVTSKVGKGSCFSLTLPLGKVETPMAVAKD